MFFPVENMRFLWYNASGKAFLKELEENGIMQDLGEGMKLDASDVMLLWRNHYAQTKCV